MSGAGLQQAQSLNQAQDADLFAAILAVLDGQAPTLPEGHPYAAVLAEVQADIVAGQTRVEQMVAPVADEVLQAVRDYVNADDWDATRVVVETQQALLFRPEVESLFTQNIAHARSAGEERAVQMLEMHLALLRQCKAEGIEAAFAQLASDEEVELPFDSELIPRSIAALLGDPQGKMAHMQYLTTLAHETQDEHVQRLLTTIQMALFSPELSQLGRDLPGVYKQAWEAIVLGVEAEGIDPNIFKLILTNTLAVLGPAASQRSAWRNNLSELRNQATAHGNRNLTALLDAVIGLVDANGNPHGLGEGLQGIYAQTWQAIMEQLPH